MNTVSLHLFLAASGGIKNLDEHRNSVVWHAKYGYFLFGAPALLQPLDYVLQHRRCRSQDLGVRQNEYLSRGNNINIRLRHFGGGFKRRISVRLHSASERCLFLGFTLGFNFSVRFEVLEIGRFWRLVLEIGSTSGAPEAAYAQAFGKGISLSEQQLVDSAGTFNNFECNGGLPSQAFELGFFLSPDLRFPGLGFFYFSVGLIFVIFSTALLLHPLPFSTSGAPEAAYAQAFGKGISLSEQQLVDCAGTFNNFECNGGLPYQAFEYIKYNGWLETEDAYPYTRKDGVCKYSSENVRVQVLDSVNITLGAEDELRHAVAFSRPVGVAFEVVNGFRVYKGGVYTSNKCGSSPLATMSYSLSMDDDYEKLIRGMNPLRVVLDNESCKNVAVIQIVTDVNLVVTKSYML
ncbi:hypothetical protein OROMI_018297 [Orobanche minor]